MKIKSITLQTSPHGTAFFVSEPQRTNDSHTDSDTQDFIQKEPSLSTYEVVLSSSFSALTALWEQPIYILII